MKCDSYSRIWFVTLIICKTHFLSEQKFVGTVEEIKQTLHDRIMTGQDDKG